MEIPMRRTTPQAIEVPDAGTRWITQTASDEQKFLLMARLYRGHLQRVHEAVAHDYPDWTERRRQIEVPARVSGRDPQVIAAARRRYGGEATDREATPA